MNARRVRYAMACIGITALSLSIAPNGVSRAGAAPQQKFHLEEATIADVQRAIHARQITAEQLVTLYFRRIEAYNGACVKGDIDPATE